AEMGFGQKINDEIVYYAPPGVKHATVKGLTGLRQLVYVISEYPPQKKTCSFALDIHRQHMRHIEHARVTPHLLMLVELRTIMQGHLPPAEIDHLGLHVVVSLIKRSCFHKMVSKNKKGEVTRMTSPLCPFYLRDRRISFRLPLRWPNSTSALSRLPVASGSQRSDQSDLRLSDSGG